MKSLLFVSLMCCGGAAVYAQGLSGLAGALSGAEADEVAVSIPFAFKAADEKLPAGRYVIQKDLSWSLLRVCRDGTRCRVVQANLAEDLNKKSNPRLVFQKLGGNHILTLVQAEGGRAYRLPGYTKKADNVVELDATCP